MNRAIVLWSSMIVVCFNVEAAMLVVTYVCSHKIDVLNFNCFLLCNSQPLRPFETWTTISHWWWWFQNLKFTLIVELNTCTLFNRTSHFKLEFFFTSFQKSTHLWTYFNKNKWHKKKNFDFWNVFIHTIPMLCSKYPMLKSKIHKLSPFFHSAQQIW